jgi:hypothetical protein
VRDVAGGSVAVQLRQALLEGVAVEEAGERIDGRAAAMARSDSTSAPESVTALRTSATAAITSWWPAAAPAGSRP